MSLWTPSGEHPVAERRAPTAPEPSRPGDDGPGPGSDAADADATDAAAADVDALRRRLAGTPAEVVVANHCYGLFELAAVYLSQSPPRLDEARLAIDALGALVDGLAARLGEAHPSLRDALAQIRLAYVQIGATGGSDERTS
jgi:hypothetical protein